MKALTFIFLGSLFSFAQTSCILEQTPQKRALAEEENALLEQQNEFKMEVNDTLAPHEQKDIKREAYSKDIYDKYIHNALKTGATPYAPCYGSNISCAAESCSKISVKASNQNDLVASIKQDGKFVTHAYIKHGESHTFLLPDGTYQTFVLMGKGWYPERPTIDEVCGTLHGGFLVDENYTYDEPVTLTNQVIDLDMELFDKLKRGEKIDPPPQEQVQDKQVEYAKAIYAKYIHNSLETGDTPYTPCYGTNVSCRGKGCSKIIVKASKENDVVASIKRDGKFIVHAYILRGESYTFDLPSGSYQPYFFMGNGWYPERKIEQKECTYIKGGFLANTTYFSDKPVELRNKVILYDLALSEEIK